MAALERAGFSPSQLMRASAEGEAGEPVAVEFEWDGRLERTFMPRGSLGARLMGVTREPEPRR